jgi:hypothetical protein
MPPKKNLFKDVVVVLSGTFPGYKQGMLSSHRRTSQGTIANTSICGHSGREKARGSSGRNIQRCCNE